MTQLSFPTKTSCALRQVPTRQHCFMSLECVKVWHRWNYFTINESRKGRVWSNSDKSLGLEGIIFITFLKCGMLREYYLSSKQYLVMLKCYLSLLVVWVFWINVHMNFRLIFWFNQKKINTTNVWRFLTEPLDITSITLYLHTLRVFCLSPNINVKTLYSLSRERWIAFVLLP